MIDFNHSVAVVKLLIQNIDCTKGLLSRCTFMPAFTKVWVTECWQNGEGQLKSNTAIHSNSYFIGNILHIINSKALFPTQNSLKVIVWKQAAYFDRMKQD